MFQQNIWVPVSVPVERSLAQLIVYNVTERSPQSQILGWILRGSEGQQVCETRPAHERNNEGMIYTQAWNRIMISVKDCATTQ